MGGGNGQKAKMAREKNLEKHKAAKGSQLETNKKAMTIQCKVCMQTFICTTSEVKCKEHAEAKHPKKSFLTQQPKRTLLHFVTFLPATSLATSLKTETVQVATTKSPEKGYTEGVS
ncbi:hypothetical protein MRB53_008885 [Persea americana]|uniref:Uncharacterized protein n=1 Tax=Persea americana TaxID=3435 RepID=A0ACC2LN88_PERAE|nr:hypothetical protein MRB53_008885 [Persea americana]